MGTVLMTYSRATCIACVVTSHWWQLPRLVLYGHLCCADMVMLC